MYRFTFVAIALFLVLTSPLALKAEVKNGQAEEIARVVVSEAKLKTVPLEISDVGKMYAVDSVVLSFNIAEKINVIHFQDGDEVKQNQVVAELDSSIARTDVAKARSEFNLARNKLSRSQDMIEREPGSIPPQKIYELNELANLAKAELDQKKAILDNYRVLAPFNGRLADFKQSVGSYIESFDPLVTLYKRDPIEVFYSVSQDKLEEISLNQNVEITSAAVKDKKFHGVVNYISPNVNINSGRVDVHARVRNPDFKLSPGMFVNVKHFLDTKEENVLVPQTAINVKDKERYVWLLSDDNTVSKKSVELGSNLNDGNVVIKAGVEENDRIVTIGSQWLKDGMKVNVKDLTATEPEPL